MAATATRKRRSGRASVPADRGPAISWDLARGELTGLVHHSGVPWDRPHTWWFDLLVTFEHHTGRRVDGMKMGVTVLPRQGRSEAIAAMRQKLWRLDAVEATVTCVHPPMDAETIMAIQEVNAAYEQVRAWRLKSLWALCSSDRRGPNWAQWRPLDPAPAGPGLFAVHAIAATLWSRPAAIKSTLFEEDTNG